MSAPSGSDFRAFPEKWRTAEIRAEWLRHALADAPADRAATEHAITGIYALLGQPRPDFVWLGSPAAAVDIVPTTPAIALGGPLALESRLASAISALRERLDRRAGPRPYDSFWSPTWALHGDGTPTRSPVTDVLDPLRRTVHDAVAGMIAAALPDRRGLHWYGQHEADWVAYYDVHQRVNGTRFGTADTAHLALWATLVRSCGWWWPREGRCFVAERPLVVRTQPLAGSQLGEVRLHGETGPAVAFPDGWTVHSWHGTRVPSWVIDGPTAELIGQEGNIEVRRCAIERLGWPAFIEAAGLRLVGRAGDPANPGCHLFLYDLPYQRWGQRSRLLLAVNGSAERDGTRRRYGLRVPPWFDDPVDAAGWSYGLTGAQYSRLLRRT